MHLRTDGVLATYSDQMCDWLVEAGYTHCFFVAGGNIMHLLNSARSRFKCIPVVHEVAAGIAAEYFNELDLGENEKAFVLVTAGPGLTNVITAMAGAQIESRELLVIGGQVKSSDLSSGGIRQRGIQEIGGSTLVESICKVSRTIREPEPRSKFIDSVNQSRIGRKGVVFLEVCLDAQGAPADQKNDDDVSQQNLTRTFDSSIYKTVCADLSVAKKPIILIGSGVSRQFMKSNLDQLISIGIPLMTTWNGADRVPDSEILNWGRPNTWGMRHSNILIQQSDYVIAVGTRLGLQHTGFNWQEFVPSGKVVQVDIDESELTKGHPKLHLGIHTDAEHFLKYLLDHKGSIRNDISDWLNFGAEVKQLVPLSDKGNNQFQNYFNPYDFILQLSQHMHSGDVLVPSSSGAAETVNMQAAQLPNGAFVVTDKGMASMGYGLGGAIGAAFKTGKRVIHIEGDGGFAQNLQELGTVRVNNLPIKTFIFENGGYASIKMTQISYFKGAFVGCDEESGLGLPDWAKLFDAFGITCRRLDASEGFTEEIIRELEDNEPRAFLVPIHPEQTYFPKITSQVMENGSMKSNPIHLMTPPLDSITASKVFRYI